MTRWLLLALLLTGCASQFAVYQHPTTGDRVECELKPRAPIQLINRYNDCKDSAEARGYVRTGTVEREPTAASGAELATPRPAPKP